MNKRQYKYLLKKLNSDKKNIDIINKIAIGLSRSKDRTINNLDYFYFKKAYNTKKTIISTHNYACYLFRNTNFLKRALKVQEQCLSFDPKSIYPYLLFAEIAI